MSPTPCRDHIAPPHPGKVDVAHLPSCAASPRPVKAAPCQGQAALAQPVEHIIRNDGVRCSSHLSGTTFLKIFQQGNPPYCGEGLSRVELVWVLFGAFWAGKWRGPTLYLFEIGVWGR